LVLIYGVYKVFGLLLAVTSTFDVLTTKSYQHIFEPKYICEQNWVKFSLLVFTVRLHVMQRTVLLLQFCPSVCPSIRRVYC